jgi:hypothetical protein
MQQLPVFASKTRAAPHEVELMGLFEKKHTPIDFEGLLNCQCVCVDTDTEQLQLQQIIDQEQQRLHGN